MPQAMTQAVKKRTAIHVGALRLICLLALSALPMSATAAGTASPLTSSLAGKPAETLRLSLDEVLTLGLENNPGLKAARAELEANTWSKRASYLAYLPSGYFSSSVTRVDDETLDQSNQAQVGLTTLFENLGVSGVEMDPFLYRDTYRSSFTLKQEFPLNLHLIGGSRFARAAERAGRQQLASGRDRLLMNLKSAAFRLLAARELLAVAEESVSSAFNRLLLARERAELGQINRAESLRWDVALAEANNGLSVADNSAVLAEMDLNRLLGLDLGTQLKIRNLTPVLERGRALAEETPEVLARRVMETGPAALAIRAGQEIGAAGETLGLAGLMPSLHFQFNYGWRENDSAALDDYRSWSATALLQVPLFDLGGRLADYRGSAAARRRIDWESEDALNSLRLAVHAAWREVHLRGKMQSQFRTAARQAKESFDLMQDRYELGHISEFDLVDAQTALSGARARDVAAQYDYYIALAALEMMVGEAPAGTRGGDPVDAGAPDADVPGVPTRETSGSEGDNKGEAR